MPSQDPGDASGSIGRKLSPGQRLPRELVAASQRERLIVAMIKLVGQVGYPAVRAGDVAKLAHVSRAAFYEHFKGGVEDCFAAAYELQAARCAAQVISAFNAPRLSAQQRARNALDAFAAFAVSAPAAAHVCLGDVLSVRAGELEDRARARAVTRALLAAACGSHRRPPAWEPVLAGAIVGGVRRLTREHVRKDVHGDHGGGSQELSRALHDWLLCYGAPRAPRTAAATAARVAGAKDARVAGAKDTRVAGAEDARVARLGSARPADALPDGRLAANGRTGGEPGPGGELAGDARERIVTAVLELCVEGGYATLSHRDIASAASVSLSTFYGLFENKQAAVLAVCQDGCDKLIDPARRAAEQAADWPSGVCAALGAYLAAAAADPARTHLVAIESAALGRDGLRALDSHAEAIERLIEPGLALRDDTRGPALRGGASPGRRVEHAHRREWGDGNGFRGGRRSVESGDADARRRRPARGDRSDRGGDADRPDMFDRGAGADRRLLQALSGAIAETVREHALERRCERLAETREALSFVVLAPFLGAREAARIAVEQPPV